MRRSALGSRKRGHSRFRGTVGWRLPSVIELKSVLDPSLPPPFVPVSVFTGILPFFYWSATTSPDLPASAWAYT